MINKAKPFSHLFVRPDNNSKLKNKTKMTHCHFQYATIYNSYYYNNLTEHQHLNDDRGKWIPKYTTASYIASTTL